MKRPAHAQSGEGYDSASQTGDWYTLPLAEAFLRQQTDGGPGLTHAEAAQRLEQYGPNALTQAHQRWTLAIFLDRLATAAGGQPDLVAQLEYRHFPRLRASAGAGGV